MKIKLNVIAAFSFFFTNQKMYVYMLFTKGSFIVDINEGNNYWFMSKRIEQILQDSIYIAIYNIKFTRRTNLFSSSFSLASCQPLV